MLPELLIASEVFAAVGVGSVWEQGVGRDRSCVLEKCVDVCSVENFGVIGKLAEGMRLRSVIVKFTALWRSFVGFTDTSAAQGDREVGLGKVLNYCWASELPHPFRVDGTLGIVGCRPSS